MTRRRQSDSLFEEPKATPGGPVYQGVSAQFRALFPSSDPDAVARKAALKGWTSLALAHARAIDAEARPTVGRSQTSSELREALAYIADATATGDTFDTFLQELRDAPPAAAPHPEV